MTIHSTSAVPKLVGSQPHFQARDLSSISAPQGHDPNFGNLLSGSVKSDTSRIISQSVPCLFTLLSGAITLKFGFKLASLLVYKSGKNFWVSLSWRIANSVTFDCSGDRQLYLN